MRPFAFAQPRSLDEVVEQLAADPGARLVAGGTDLIIGLRDGTTRATTVIDLKQAAGLDGAIGPLGDGLSFGALSSMTDIAENSRVRSRWTALAEGAAVVGSVHIRNRATLAGNVCNASPAADTTPALLIFDAIVVVRGPHGERRVPIDDVFVRSRTTTLGTGEVVVRIELPEMPGRVGSTHLRRTRRRGHDLASVTLACSVHESGEARIAFGSVGPRPVLVRDQTGVLAAAETSDAERLAILDRLFAAAAPSPRSMRATPEYRLAMLRVLGLRALAVAGARLAEASA